jgi:hypothetical protein
MPGTSFYAGPCSPEAQTATLDPAQVEVTVSLGYREMAPSTGILKELSSVNSFKRRLTLLSAWVRSPAVDAVGLERKASDVLIAVSAVPSDSVEVVNSVRLPMLGALAFGFEYFSGGRCVADCIGVV